MLDINYCETAEVAIDRMGDGELPHLWGPPNGGLACLKKHIDGGFTAAMVFECPFTYATACGDVGAEGCSEMIDIGSVGAALTEAGF